MRSGVMYTRLFSGTPCFAVAVLLLNVVSGELHLRQSVVISRHGSRTLLEKDHRTFVEPKDSQLTVRGMDQMFRAGKFARSHFDMTDADFLSTVYNPSEIYVRSSDYARTLNSASSFLFGLYPLVEQNITTSTGTYKAPHNIQQIPIHTVSVRNDQLLRGWLDCPTLQSRLDKFFASEEFKEKERKSEDLFRELEHITGIKKVELKNFYNVYDFIHLRKVYNHTFLNLTESQWRRVKELADWIEYGKYSKATMGSIGGGILANEIATNFQATVALKRKAKVLFYSAHYPTIVSLFSALDLNQASSSQLRKIPYYASLVFLDLYQESDNSQEFVVKFSFRNGLEGKALSYQLPGCTSDPCTLGEFVAVTNAMKVRDMTSWCDACNNREHLLCHASELVLATPDKHSFTAVGGFFTGVFATLVIVGVSVGVWRFILKKRCHTPSKRPMQSLPEQEYSQFYQPQLHDTL